MFDTGQFHWQERRTCNVDGRTNDSYYRVESPRRSTVFIRKSITLSLVFVNAFSEPYPSAKLPGILDIEA